MIKLVVFDFDGVFSDGKFIFNDKNDVYKSYNAKDAYSLKMLKNNNINCGIITNDKIISIENAPHIFNRLNKVSIGSDNPKLETKFPGWTRGSPWDTPGPRKAPQGPGKRSCVWQSAGPAAKAHREL